MWKLNSLLKRCSTAPSPWEKEMEDEACRYGKRNHETSVANTTPRLHHRP